MTQFLAWFDRNRTPIGYTVGGLNVLSGLADLALGNVFSGIFWILIGVVILFDTWQYK